MGAAKERPSPAEIERLRAERAAKKERLAAEKEAQANTPPTEPDSSLYVPRKWARVQRGAADGASSGGGGVRIGSWNLLAQGLVRRKLFPGSDCLKWKDREAGLRAELVGHAFDIACFQEVDRLDSHGPNLKSAGFNFVYEKGYAAKQHGLLIGWRTKPRSVESPHFAQEPLAQKLIFFDDLSPRTLAPAKEPERSGCSRITRNVALLVALPFASRPGGIIVGTTHLFWHPQHAYERVRQAGLLMRAADAFRAERPQTAAWDVVVAGDFNDQPHSATYQLLREGTLNDHAREEILRSSVVHRSIDEARARAQAGIDGDDDAVEEEGDDEADGDTAAAEQAQQKASAAPEADSDHMLKNCRAATADDGLLTLDELTQLHSLEVGKAVSAYGSYFSQLEGESEEGNYFGSPARGRERFDDESYVEGQPNVHSGPSTEPMWTLFSSIFSLTLDYIWLLPRRGGSASYPPVVSLLRTHRTEVLQPGVPRKGVCASDHVAIGAEIVPHME